jgi:hypothetical protein
MNDFPYRILLRRTRYDGRRYEACLAGSREHAVDFLSEFGTVERARELVAEVSRTGQPWNAPSTVASDLVQIHHRLDDIKLRILQAASLISHGGRDTCWWHPKAKIVWWCRAQDGGADAAQVRDIFRKHVPEIYAIRIETGARPETTWDRDWDRLVPCR